MKKVLEGIDFFSKDVVNNNFPVRPEMYGKRVIELARLIGIEAQDIPQERKLDRKK